MVASVMTLGKLLACLPYFARNLAVKAALRRRWFLLCRALGHTHTTVPY